ncbi:hypothetical protein ACRQ5Q_40675 [Bradyrhizobium sp. PMVTL-01]|uniref:hypothetical protein n=1 Tax=Bradyrhizobium sp. PMVTL-01 TaxID=3434999 RepID=UPI003F6FE787
MSKFIVFEDVSADLGAPIIDGNGARDYYRLGYFRCAREAAVALKQLKGDNRSAMPILFLYRQYIESALKDALHLSNAFDLEQSDKKFGHDLAALWLEAKQVLSRFVAVKTLETIDETIAEYDAIDRRADAFRYAVDRNGERHFKDYGIVLLHELIEQLDWVHHVLEESIVQIRAEERELDRAIAEAVARDRT